MQSIKILFIVAIFFPLYVYAGNDKNFQPKSLFTTCFLVAAKNINDFTEIDRCPLEFKEPLKALSHAHHNQEFDKKHLKKAFNICFPSSIKEYYAVNQEELNNLCWIIKYDAKNNLNNALSLIPLYTQKLLNNKQIATIALLSLGANTNETRTIKNSKEIIEILYKNESDDSKVKPLIKTSHQFCILF